MSFRDCIPRQTAECEDAHTNKASQPQIAATPLITTASYQEDVFLSPRSVVETTEVAAAEVSSSAVASARSVGGSSDNGEGKDSPELPKGSTEAVQNACNDAVILQSAAAASSHGTPAASVRSGGGYGRGRFNHRIINASVPISFTKTFCATVQWGHYRPNSHGYLNAEAVQAAAAADERSIACSERGIVCSSPAANSEPPQHSQPVGRSGVGITIAESLRTTQEADRLRETPHCMQQHMNMSYSSTPAMRSTYNDNTSKREAAGRFTQRGSSSVRQNTRVGGGGSSRPILRSWLFGGSGASTELERILKEENDLAETAAARHELAATKLVQEDMEAMIANLQQVKTFLVEKLRECETALLTTAQERDGLEATLQQIQSGIQDSVAENRRQAEACKEKLTQKEREVEELRAQLEQAMAEASSLRKENEMLKAEVSVARVEAAVSLQTSSTDSRTQQTLDVAAAEGFRIEEYRLALQTLMERNKAQRRELKRLRGQLIKTREDFACALARVDELESLEEYRRSQIHPDETASAPQGNSPYSGHSAGRPQHNSEGPQGAQGAPSSGGVALDEWQADMSREPQSERQAERGADGGASGCDTDSGRHCGSERSSDKAAGSLPSCARSSSGNQEHEDTLGERGLGRRVKGLLTSGVTQLLQSIENAISTERDPPELSTDPESTDSVDTSPQEERGLYEEAALFLQRTSGSRNRDLIVHLEDGDEGHSEAEEDVMNSKAADSTTLGNVARHMWQAAHELIADRAMPPARLSTLRRPGVVSSSMRASPVSRRRVSAAAGAGGFNVARIERVRRGASPRGCIAVELQPELPPGTSDARSDVEEASERLSESKGVASSPAREAEAQASTETEHGAASAAAESKMPQTTDPPEEAEQAEGSPGVCDASEAKPEDAARPEASDSVGECTEQPEERGI
ncbi:hypothetical protein, conserved [Eimeria praecox]|uniref:Uncharacterized protein n=1 Tax=Eimeria praecox TaxID=51316 RepID=U6H0L5_9EIME|nr:hypothetical protein, conserved [Eimeria praecox]